MPTPSTSRTDCGKTPSERTMKCCKQRAKQRAKSKQRKMASHTSSSTGMASQPKVTPVKQSNTLKKTGTPGSKVRFLSTPNDSYPCDDHHHRERDQSRCQDGDTYDSCNHDHRSTAPHHHTQSEQARQPHSLGFYEEGHPHAFAPFTAKFDQLY
uniref:Uncharacterized protein n=1 Tax=Romanomermis culicivorax TaxID=13658 RepID=A0A915INN7_ROMCU